MASPLLAARWNRAYLSLGGSPSPRTAWDPSPAGAGGSLGVYWCRHAAPSARFRARFLQFRTMLCNNATNCTTKKYESIKAKVAASGGYEQDSPRKLGTTAIFCLPRPY